MSLPEALRVEFSSKSSGAYIHEMTDRIEMDFKDKDGQDYKLVVHKVFATDDMTNIDIELKYPDGQVTVLESVWTKQDEEGDDVDQ